MTGKVVDGDPKGLLVLILPLAVGMVFIYKAWRWILLGLTVAIAWVAWDSYQWQQKCVVIDPIFKQLIQRNQGIITQADLIEQGIAKGRAAQRYLNDKVAEYGAYQQTVGEATAYYFITSSTLGTIFDDSEPTEVETTASPQLTAATTPAVTLDTPPVAQPSKPIAAKNKEELAAAPAGNSPFAQLAELKEERKHQEPKPVVESVQNDAETAKGKARETLTLIQSELAKRLDTTSSTIARRKNEENFGEWSQSKDPDGLAWAYNVESKLFTAG